MAQLLDLSALERDTAKLADGTIVEIRNPADLSVVDSYKLDTLLNELANTDPSLIESEEEAVAAAEKMHAALHLIVAEAPTIDDASAGAIVAAWIEKHVKPLVGGSPLPPRTRRRTTVKSSRASKRSTAATRKSGSQKSRGTR